MNPALMLCHKCATKAVIDSVLNQDVDVELFCIENDATPGVQKVIKPYLYETPRRVHSYVASPQLFVSAGWNYGLRFWFNTRDADFVWVLNDDIICRPDNLRELRDDGGLFVTAVGLDKMEDVQAEFVKSVRPHPHFSNFLIRRECWERVGPFDESMKLYASDADYHVRMHQAGIQAYTIGMPFFHQHSGSIKASTPEDASAIHSQADLDREAFRRKWHIDIGSPEYYALFQVTNKQEFWAFK